MKNPIIEARLNRMIQIKKELLTMKKSERGNQVKEIEDVINRLKKWLADPATEVRTPRNEHAIHDNHANQQQDNKKINPFATVNQAMKEFAKALGNIGENQDRKSEREIRDIIVNVGRNGNKMDPFEWRRQNGIEMNQLVWDDPIPNPGNDDHIDAMTKIHRDWIQSRHHTPGTKETPGKRPKSMSKSEIMDPTDTNGPKNDGKWRQPVVENVHTVFRRMNGMD